MPIMYHMRHVLFDNICLFMACVSFFITTKMTLFKYRSLLMIW